MIAMRQLSQEWHTGQSASEADSGMRGISSIFRAFRPFKNKERK
jgi:hypothetical protein